MSTIYDFMKPSSTQSDASAPDVPDYPPPPVPESEPEPEPALTMGVGAPSPIAYDVDHLKTVNGHARDEHIVFYEDVHKYVILSDRKSRYTSVTTWVHQHFEKFDADKIISNMMNSANWPNSKYHGQTPDEIKLGWDNNRDSAAAMGTQIHYMIECFMNLGQFMETPDGSSDDYLPSLREIKEYYDSCPTVLDTCKKDSLSVDLEFSYFLDFVSKFPHMIPYRTEWCVFDEDIKLSGSIDMLFKDQDGKFHIYDWKRSREIVEKTRWAKYSTTPELKHILDTNYWHYAIQLNTYKLILERKYGISIESMYLVCLHPNNTTGSYELYRVVDLEFDLNPLIHNMERVHQAPTPGRPTPKSVKANAVAPPLPSSK